MDLSAYITNPGVDLAFVAAFAFIVVQRTKFLVERLYPITSADHDNAIHLYTACVTIALAMFIALGNNSLHSLHDSYLLVIQLALYAAGGYLGASGIYHVAHPVPATPLMGPLEATPPVQITGNLPTKLG